MKKECIANPSRAMADKKKSESQQSENMDSTTGKPPQREMSSFPSAPDSHPIFKRGFAIGGKGFNKPRPTKKKPE